MIPFFFYRTIYKGKSYVVRQNWRNRWLAQPDGTIHSCINRHAYYKSSLEYLPPMLQFCTYNSGDYLILGLGGGSMLHALENKLTRPNIDVVEIDPEIIDISKQYFYLNELHYTNLIEEDAATYVDKCDKKYNVILVDLYQEKACPKQCVQPIFFEHCRNILKPGGIVALNCANMDQYSDLLTIIRKVFYQSIITIRIAHPRNVILVASTSPIQTLIKDIPLKKLGWHAKTGLVGDYKNKE